MDSPEILVVGPRQACKTALLRRINSQLENSNFVTFEDRDVLNLFEEDEKEFAEVNVKEGEKEGKMEEIREKLEEEDYIEKVYRRE